MTKKNFEQRLERLEATVVKTRRRREFDFSTMSAAQLWTLSIRVGEALGRRRYFWQVEARLTGVEPPFTALPMKLEQLTRHELVAIADGVRSEMQRRYVGDRFHAEAKLHADALDELKAR